MGHNFKMKQWVRDLIYGIVLVVFAVGNTIYANTLPPGSIKIKAAQAGTYLAIVMIMLGILGICLIVRSLSQKSQKECTPLFNRATVVTILAMVLYLFLLDKLGFLLSSVLFVFALITYYSFEQSQGKFFSKGIFKKLAAYFLCAIITTGVCYYLFGTVLTVVLPQFSLF